MYYDFTAVLIFILLGSVFVIGSLLFGWLVRPRKKQKQKESIYECGEPTMGSAWIRFNSRFYNIARFTCCSTSKSSCWCRRRWSWRELAGTLCRAPFIAILFPVRAALGLAYEGRWGISTGSARTRRRASANEMRAAGAGPRGRRRSRQVCKLQADRGPSARPAATGNEYPMSER